MRLERYRELLIDPSIDIVATRGYNKAMHTLKTVGIRKLKNSLSSYIREVKSGAIILITDRGDIVAELKSPDREYSQLNRDRLKQEWIDSNKLLLPLYEKKTIRRSPVSLPEGTSIRILDNEREESR